MAINDQLCFSFACQVLEYHPQPWNQWVKIGDLAERRCFHATLSIGVEQLSCFFPGESFNIEQRGFGIDNNNDDNNDTQQ